MSFIALPNPDTLFKGELYHIMAFLLPYLRHWICKGSFESFGKLWTYR